MADRGKLGRLALAAGVITVNSGVYISTAVADIWTLPRDEAIRVLRHQISWARTYSEQLLSSAEEFPLSEIASDGRPWVVPEHYRLTAGLVQARAEWAERLLARFEKGQIPGFPTTERGD